MDTQGQEITIYQGTSELEIIHKDDRTEQIIARWLDVKTAKSKKTEQAYKLVMSTFRSVLQARGLDVFSDLRIVAELASVYAHTSYDRRARVKAGRLAEGTINQRLAILSSFYVFCHKYDSRIENPIAICDRETRNVHDAAIHFDASDIESALQKIKRDKLQGKRDYALLLLALTTGRRAAELTALVCGDLRTKGKQIQVTWQRCKGNKTMQDILGSGTRDALESYLKEVYPSGELASDAPVFVSLSNNHHGQAMTTQAVSDICKKFLGTSKVHATRHTFAVNSELAGASLSEIGERLGHNSLAVTSDYMKRRHSDENKHVGKLEALYGLFGK